MTEYNPMPQPPIDPPTRPWTCAYCEGETWHPIEPKDNHVSPAIVFCSEDCRDSYAIETQEEANE